jgi:hypothetical protein
VFFTNTFVVENFKKKFDYDEIVVVTSPRLELIELKNLEGYIAGDVFDENNEKWFYGVFIFEKEIVYYIGEEELTSTGRFFSRE